MIHYIFITIVLGLTQI